MWNILEKIAKKCDPFLKIGGLTSLVIAIIAYIGTVLQDRSTQVIYDTDYSYSRREDIRRELGKMFDNYRENITTFMREIALAENAPTNEVERLVEQTRQHFSKHEKVFRHYWEGIMEFVYKNEYEHKSIHIRNLSSKKIDELRVFVTGYTNLRDVELSSASPRSDVDWFRKEMTEDKNKRRVMIPYRMIEPGDTITFTLLADTAATADVAVQAFASGKAMKVSQMTYSQYADSLKAARMRFVYAAGACVSMLALAALIRLHIRLRALESRSA
jgi:hypothetical protein